MSLTTWFQKLFLFDFKYLILVILHPTANKHINDLACDGWIVSVVSSNALDDGFGFRHLSTPKIVQVYTDLVGWAILVFHIENKWEIEVGLIYSTIIFTEQLGKAQVRCINCVSEVRRWIAMGIHGFNSDFGFPDSDGVNSSSSSSSEKMSPSISKVSPEHPIIPFV